MVLSVLAIFGAYRSSSMCSPRIGRLGRIGLEVRWHQADAALGRSYERHLRLPILRGVVAGTPFLVAFDAALHDLRLFNPLAPIGLPHDALRCHQSCSTF